MYVDAHFHLADYLDCCSGTDNPQGIFAPSASYCCSAHNRIEFERQRSLVTQGACAFFHRREPVSTADHCVTGQISGGQSNSISIPEQQFFLFSFGIHPQNPVPDEADFLHFLLETKQIQAIGECGFDLFDAHYKQTLPAQQKIWNLQLQLAQEFHVPIVVHCRKALPLLFESVPRLKKLPAIIFHGWGGSLYEATAFVRKGVNAYFSLGKAVLRGQKSVCAMAAEFDSTRLLTETDAPYMRLKHEPFSHPQDIAAVAARCADLRKTDTAEFLHHTAQNFRSAFGV